MICSDLPSPAEASSQTTGFAKGFAQAGNRHPRFGIMLYDALRLSSASAPISWTACAAARRMKP